MLYFIGDTHFGEENVFEICNGWHKVFPFLEEKDDFLINEWNRVVSKDDTVIIVGDFGDPSVAANLNGKKILVMGNHDWEWWNKLEKHEYEYFESVSHYPIVVKDFYMVSHEPMYVSSDGAMANIFAHVHDNPNYKDVSSRGFCVSAERIGWAPISFEEIIKRMKKEEKKNCFG